MDWSSFVMWLFGVTLLAGAAIGVWQLVSVRHSRHRRGESGHVPHPAERPGGPQPPRR
jgi:hypothetical protein